MVSCSLSMVVYYSLSCLVALVGLYFVCQHDGVVFRFVSVCLPLSWLFLPLSAFLLLSSPFCLQLCWLFMGLWVFGHSCLPLTSLLHSLICLPVRLLVPIHPLTFVFRSYVLTGPFVCLLWAGLEDLGSDWLWVGRRLSCVFWSQVLLSLYCHLLTLWLAC